ncbi:hypothetical protein TraAM80_06339 [Trypanosoma rangeli]|uniref:Uncharacterized protein n=1 Tax=Trypanosoma rangeli TaxID=5698 RepID=A0A3R7N965_TRYRA|nr:uncharacterized protein TraAM80_06339 [Trypanosoma rangeli]RNF02514.1 hypothetical protein TraAM80_06339 [Trypanosoma rangeli]|eukprot:RNF02514.1 hypothetical protein TraAM80_06339 [Trypanosoma rangeli]
MALAVKIWNPSSHVKFDGAAASHRGLNSTKALCMKQSVPLLRFHLVVGIACVFPSRAVAAVRVPHAGQPPPRNGWMKTPKSSGGRPSARATPPTRSMGRAVPLGAE